LVKNSVDFPICPRRLAHIEFTVTRREVMLENLLNEPIMNEAIAEAAPVLRATPLLFDFREKLPEVKVFNLTNTGSCTDLPQGEVWDEDYDS
jgi:hypothetical protein